MKRLWLYISVCFIVLFGTQVLAQDALDPQVSDMLQAVLDDAVTAGNPGAVMWIDSPMGNFEGASGTADVDAGIVLQPDDSFRIGSITKTLTATIILQLVEENVLTLDDLLARWLPETAATLPYGDQMTLRQLLNHTAGVADYEVPVTPSLADPETRHRQWLPEEVVAFVADQEASFAPGEGFSYSNTGYILLGMVIEVATGKTLVENYHQRILDPLDMRHTYLSDYEEPTSTLVRGYSNILSSDDYNASVAGSAGGLVSNGPDMVTFFRALMTGQLFNDAATLQTMLTTYEQAILPGGTAYALGIMQTPTPIGDAYGNRGQIFGFQALSFYFPDYDIVLVAMVNADEMYVNLGSVLEILTELV